MQRAALPAGAPELRGSFRAAVRTVRPEPVEGRIAHPPFALSLSKGASIKVFQ
jgi:hypothetical protein